FADKDVIEMQTVSVVGDIIYSSSGLATGFAPGTPDTEECAVRRKLCDYTGKDAITGERVISVSTPPYHPEGQLTGTPARRARLPPTPRAARWPRPSTLCRWRLAAVSR
ncbi:MAG: hypothetical protein MJ141_07840, partial [Clostridia bacterium]|nr:hypothetical protein [Clostridia bacterium]